MSQQVYSSQMTFHISTWSSEDKSHCLDKPSEIPADSWGFFLPQCQGRRNNVQVKTLHDAPFWENSTEEVGIWIPKLWNTLMFS